VKRLKDAGLDPVRDRALLATRWRCVTPSCLRARFWQDQLLSWPDKDASGQACCPGCGEPLSAAGPRGLCREVVVRTLDGQTELARWPLEHGVPVVIGRGREDQGISLDAVSRAPEQVGRISRQHALLQLDEQGRLHVVDLGSSNGTVVRRGPDAPALRLESDRGETVGKGGWVEVAGVLRLELSGQRFPMALEAPPPSSDRMRTELWPGDGDARP
jgi:hypothetical protein